MSYKKNPVAVHGPWFAMPLDFLQSRACAELSAPASKMLLDLCSQLGRNSRGNGDLTAAESVMRPRGWSSNTTRLAALRELLEASLIIITRHGNRRRTTLYAITLWAMDCDFRKLDHGPGCYRTSDWTKADKRLEERPTQEQPAAWRSVRKAAFTGPAMARPPANLAPLRDHTERPMNGYRPAGGPKADT